MDNELGFQRPVEPSFQRLIKVILLMLIEQEIERLVPSTHPLTKFSRRHTEVKILVAYTLNFRPFSKQRKKKNV